MAFLVSGKTEFLCLLRYKMRLLKRKFKLERKLFETENASKICHVNKFYIISITPGFFQPIQNSKEIMFKAKILASV